MAIAALFTVAKIWKEPKYPSVEESIKKLWYSIDRCGSVFWASFRQVQVLVRAHAWREGLVSIWGCAKGNRLMILSHTDVSLPLSLPFCLSKSKQIEPLKEKLWYIYTVENY